MNLPHIHYGYALGFMIFASFIWCLMTAAVLGAVIKNYANIEKEVRESAVIIARNQNYHSLAALVISVALFLAFGLS